MRVRRWLFPTIRRDEGRGRQCHATPTIVEYTEEKRPENVYPVRIISPPRPGPCCFSDMEAVGEPKRDGRWVFQYRRCTKCGFTVRLILREIVSAALVADLQQTLAKSFIRNTAE